MGSIRIAIVMTCVFIFRAAGAEGKRGKCELFVLVAGLT